MCQLKRAGRRKAPAFLVVTAALVAVSPAAAQVDIAGNWQPRQMEDAYYRGGPGPRPGEAVGLPLNEAGTLRAQSHDVSSHDGAPERMCKIYGPDLIYSGGGNHAQFVKDVDPFSNEIVAWHNRHEFQSSESTYWMDGRAHPDDLAPHTFQGFSTGEWVGNALRVTTTHLKEAQLIRNGTVRSDKATIVEYWIRHGDYLTNLTIVRDPVYLTEPYVKSWNFVRNNEPDMQGYTCRPREEVADWVPGTVGHYLPGKNPFLEDTASKTLVPVDALGGGADQMYPEYILKLKNMPKPSAKPAEPVR
jgi:hypothetical protein